MVRESVVILFKGGKMRNLTGRVAIIIAIMLLVVMTSGLVSGATGLDSSDETTVAAETQTVEETTAEETTAEETTPEETTEQETTVEETTPEETTEEISQTSPEETTPVVETEPETEPQTEPVIDEPKGFDINDICYDRDAFVAFSKSFALSLKSNYPNSYPVFDFGYGDTTLFIESGLTVQMLNMDYCDFSSYVIDSDSLNYLDNYSLFLYNFKFIKDFLNTDVDFSRYTVNSHVGNFLNDMDKAYKDGRYHQFMEESIQNGYFNEEIMNNAGAYTILYSYDKGEFLNQDDVDNVFNGAKNSISNSLSGSSFKK